VNMRFVEQLAVSSSQRFEVVESGCGVEQGAMYERKVMKEG
jgi:hypothetical protein